MPKPCKQSPLVSAFRLVACLPLVWSSAMAKAEPPQNVVAPAGFDDFDDRQDYPSEDALKGLLAPVQNEDSQIKAESWHQVRACRISGLLRVNKPWGKDSALRLSFPDTPEGLRLHLWSGQQGITLAYYPGFHHTWAAYSATREGKEPQPAELVLCATDCGRYRRCGLGTLELHHQAGRLTLTRGDLLLLSVPFNGPPAEVYLECRRTVVRGLAMVQSPGIPESPAASPVVFRSNKPAELEWSITPQEEISWNRLPDGRMELLAGEKSPAAQAATRIVKPGLYEFVFLLEDPEPNTGVYLGNDEGRQLCRLGFLLRNQSKRTVLASAAWFDPRHHPAPYVGQRSWFRLTVGAGVAKCWTSGDGVHWSQYSPTAETLEGACTRVGLYCDGARRRRAIKLALIEVRRLDALMSLAPEEILDRVDVSPLVKINDVTAWEQLVTQSRPEDVPADAWWRACMVRTLSENPRLQLGQGLLDRLQEWAITEPRDLPEKLRLLDETALLMHPGHNQPMERLARRYRRLGAQLVQQGHNAPLTTISRAMLRSSLWTDRPLPVFDEPLLRHEVFMKLSEDRLAELEELCRQVCYWNRTGRRDGDSASWSEQVKHLVFWAEAQATGQLPKDAEPTVVGPSPWRHPLVVTSTREGYNIFAEFSAALEGQTYREACQILSSAAQTGSLGLLPDKDQRLWVSLPVAVALAMRENPPLRQAMQEGFGPLGELRFKKAAAEGDEAAVAAVALQFYGTTAASDAHRWLGDRKLAAGRFAEALGHYERAIDTSAEPPSENSLARQRLAAALLGRESGKPTNADVEIGGGRLSPSQFEAVVSQLRQTRRPLSSQPQPVQTSPYFVPGSYEVRPWAVIENAHIDTPDSVKDAKLDWAGRQMAVTIADGQMFVNNQVDLFAFDLATGRQDWVQSGPKIKSQWPLVPMKPVVVEGRVLVRRLAEAKPELACFGSADGHLLWSCKPDSYVACDSLFIGEDLFALTVSEETADKLILMLNSLDIDSGRVRSRVPLAEFYDLWQRRLSFQATFVEDKIVVVGGGCVLCCDSAGEVHWIRRQLWVPPLRPDSWFEQYPDSPLVHKGHLYAMQPGSWCAECLELKTGRLLWRQAVPELARLVGISRGRLIAMATDGLVGLEAASGKPLWFHAAEGVQQTQLCGPDATILFVQSTKVEGKDSLVSVWLDTETGELRETSTWSLPAESTSFCGPMTGDDGRQWGFFSSASNPPRRAVLELIPTGAEVRMEDVR